jgi:DNA-binding ferritin-like protein (Dps family)
MWRQPHWYYRLQKIKKYMFGFAPNGIASIQDFLKILFSILELYGRKGTDRQERHIG